MEKNYDVVMASKVIDGEVLEKYGRVFYSSSDNFNEIFKKISVEDKNVLTVLGSSDPYFYSYYYGARKVDSFDINKLTKYYYYLRLWGIEYLDEFYPDIRNHKYIYNLLQLVKCNNDEETIAYDFWNSYIRSIYPFDNEKLFYVNSDIDRNIDIDKLHKSIHGKNNCFYHVDIKDKFTDNKYDVIILSNMLEFCDDKLELIRNNLKTLLNDDGVIICRNILTNGYRESQIFSEIFKKNSLGTYKDDKVFSMNFPLGYVYKKDVNKK